MTSETDNDTIVPLPLFGETKHRVNILKKFIYFRIIIS